MQASYASALSFQEGETFLELPGAKAKTTWNVVIVSKYIFGAKTQDQAIKQ
jgi:hypothetical protein